MALSLLAMSRVYPATSAQRTAASLRLKSSVTDVIPSRADYITGRMGGWRDAPRPYDARVEISLIRSKNSRLGAKKYALPFGIT